MRNAAVGLLFLLLSIVFFFEACQTEQEINYERYYTNGKQVYELHCENCHGKAGEGLAKLYPALTDSAFLITNRDKLYSIVKYGLNEPVVINGVKFTRPMPAHSDLADIDIKAVITYITNSFGNKQGLYVVAETGTK